MSRDLTDALSKLFIKLGGKISDSKENKGPVDYIDDITNIVEPGGGGGGSSDIFIVKILTEGIWNTEQENLSLVNYSSFSSDKSYDDIVEAYNSGKSILFNIEEHLTLEDESENYILCISGFPRIDKGGDGEVYDILLKVNNIQENANIGSPIISSMETGEYIFDIDNGLIVSRSNLTNTQRT